MSHHVLINLSWACQLECPYCLLPHIKINRKAKIHSWSEWAAGIIANISPDSVADIAGGDPLLFPGLAFFVQALGEAGIYWAITTNAIHTKAIDKLIAIKPKKCALINVSDHPGNQGQEVEDNIIRLRAAFPLVMNRVDIQGAGKRNNTRISSIIPYQSWREGTELDGIKQWCDSGLNHWVADPAGNVFRCNPDMARAFEPIGNLFTGLIIPPAPIICESGCSSCYTSVPGAWPVEMRKI